MAEPDKKPVTLEELLVPLQKGKNGLRGLCLFLVLLLGFSLAARAATLFPNRSRGWNKIPTIVVLGQEGDSRNQLVNDAVDFWNKQLAEIGSGFRLGPVTLVSEIISQRELVALSQAMLDGEREPEPPSGLTQIEGDLIIALSDGAFVSFSMSFPKAGKRLIGIRSFQIPLFRGNNVGRNVIAHELGHAIGLGHNDDPVNLMCGRPATGRISLPGGPLLSSHGRGETISANALSANLEVRRCFPGHAPCGRDLYPII